MKKMKITCQNVKNVKNVKMNVKNTLHFSL